MEVVFVRFFARVEREVGNLDELSRYLDRQANGAVAVCFEILPERVAVARLDGMVAVRRRR